MRSYRIPGPNWLAIMLAVIAEIFILIALLVLIMQPGHDFIKSALPVIIGVLLTVVVGEFLLKRNK